MEQAKLDARIKRSRQLMQEALVSLIEEKGYEELTVRDITERAALNRSTFYLHYRDKEDLLYKTAQEVLQELGQCFHDSTGIPPQPNEPTAAQLHLFEHVAHHADFYRVMLSERGFPRFHTHMENVMRKCFSQAIDRLHLATKNWKVPYDFFVNYISAAHMGLIMWWLQNDMPYTAKYMATQLTHLTASTAKSMGELPSR